MKDWTRVMAAVDGRAVVELASRLIRIPSITGDEQELAEYLVQQAGALGLEVATQELVLPGEGRRGRMNVLVSWARGPGGPRLMLNGHLDTEPVAPDYRTRGIDPFSGEVREGWLYGLGSVNMKSALAAFLGALDALRREGEGLRGEVVAACVAGEIQGGMGSRLLLESGLLRPDMVIVGEETDLAVVTAHAGCINASITLTGKPTHMNWPDKGKSVAGALRQVLAALDDLKISHDPERAKIKPKVNLGFIQGGYEDRTGLFLDHCRLGLSVRGPLEVTPATVQADLDRFVGSLRLDPEVKVVARSLHPAYSWMPPFEARGSEAIISALAEAHREATGAEPHVGLGPLDYAGTDAGVFQCLGGIPCAVYGPGGSSGTFSAPEKVETEHIVTAARVYAGAAARLLAR